MPTLFFVGIICFILLQIFFYSFLETLCVIRKSLVVWVEASITEKLAIVGDKVKSVDYVNSRIFFGKLQQNIPYVRKFADWMLVLEIGSPYRRYCKYLCFWIIIYECAKKSFCFITKVRSLNI